VFHYFDGQPYSDSISIDFAGEKHTAGKDISYNRRVEIYFKENMAEDKNTLLENNVDTLAITEKYEISHIYFIPDKAIVDPATFFAVDDAAKYLKHFPGCKFEIVGHVNYAMLPSAVNNPKNLEPAQRLSEERAKTIYDLFIERGIPAESMTHKGVGNSQMVFKNPKNDEEKRKNMRVEILISCKK
jgi:outer membrane protein OmpA-like peptidoglycan-associated protein